MDDEVDWGYVEDTIMELDPGGGSEGDWYLDPYQDESQMGDESDWVDMYGDDMTFDLQPMIDNIWDSSQTDEGPSGAGESGVTYNASDESSASDDRKSGAQEVLEGTPAASDKMDVAAEVSKQGESLSPNQDLGSFNDPKADEIGKTAITGGDADKTLSSETQVKEGPKITYGEDEKLSEEAAKREPKGGGSGFGRSAGAGLGKAGEKMADYKTQMDLQKLKGQQSMEQIEAKKAKGGKKLWLKPRGTRLATYSGGGIVNRAGG